MTTNEAIAIATSTAYSQCYRYREASLELANAVLNLRQELEIARTEQKGKLGHQARRIMKIAVDFDGTIVEHKFPEIGKDADGAFYWLQKYVLMAAIRAIWIWSVGL